MILPSFTKAPERARRNGANRGFTLVETMVALLLGMLVLAAMASTSIFCLRTFAGIYNYSEIDATSRQALDEMSKEIRQATGVVVASNSVITVVNTNVVPVMTNTYTWNADKAKLTWDKTGQEQVILLTGCTSFTNVLLQGLPSTNYTFPLTATTPDQCKIIAVKWRCSRTILGINLNSETEQAAEIVLRNKQ